MTGRRRRDGDQDEAPRVRGAWTTPAVVVRRPDGSVVTGEQRAARPPAAADPARQGGRPRPRRIPGAPGAVLIAPTLSDPGAEIAPRRRRRPAAGPVPDARRAARSPLPPRPTAVESPAALPSVPVESPAAPRPVSADRVAGWAVGLVRRPHTRPGERAPGRVRRAVSRLSFDRLLPDDDEARQRRAARLRRAGMGVTGAILAAVVIYAVFPVRTALDLRSSTDRARERLEAFQEENARLEDEARDLREDERIELEARELGLVRPGEELYGITPSPEAPAPQAGGSSTTSTTRPGG
ncbi:MAG TPA: septum formation initiator family protein [Acidimicrobiales bacterium]|nr:septum formation initiator family protein [Acidimicrobiales bacterium]